MPVNLRHRDFLKEIDFTTSELQFLLDLSRDLKRAKYAGTEVKLDGVEHLILREDDILGVIEK